MEATRREKPRPFCLTPSPADSRQAPHKLQRHRLIFRWAPTTQASPDGPDIEALSGAGFMVPEPWGQGEGQLRLPWNDAHGGGSLPP